MNTRPSNPCKSSVEDAQRSRSTASVNKNGVVGRGPSDVGRVLSARPLQVFIPGEIEIRRGFQKELLSKNIHISHSLWLHLPRPSLPAVSSETSDKKMSGSSPAFPKTRKRREDGSNKYSSYGMAWRGCPWQPLIASAKSLSQATSNGMARSIAEDQEPGPGAYELSIAYKDNPQKRIKVYIGAAESLRNAAVLLVTDGGDLRGFLDHALKEGHVVWIRCKRAKSSEDAAAIRDKILGVYDYPWVQQPGGRARSLTVRPSFLCCGCCCRTGVTIKEGPPKFVQPKTGGILSMLSGKKR